MNLGNFWIKLDALTNKPSAHPDINVILCTLEGEYPVGIVELTEDGDGNIQLQINSDEPVHREEWE